MSVIVRINFTWWQRVRLFYLLSVVALTGSVRQTQPHDAYTAYIQHRLHLSAGTGRLDVIVDLTFFEEWSSRERRRIDADHDGHLTKMEVKAYLDRLAPELAKKARLLVAGREITLTPLYDPEIDLLGNDKAGPSHHRLRLFFFAPDTPLLKAGDAIVFEERFWPEASALVTLNVEGLDGCKLEPARTDPVAALADRSQKVVFRIRCLKPPTATVSRERAGGVSSTTAVLEGQ